MTDREIIKALERMSAEDADGFSSDILDLINRQEAEIASLEARRQEACKTILAFNHELLHIKIDAIKEFVERLKAIYDNDERYATYYEHTLIVKLFYKIDDLVEKMTEDNRGE